jgi:hypothetical protein
VARLVERLSGVESCIRGEQQSWLPVLAVLAVEGLAALMRERWAEAFEALRRQRLAVARDDAGSTVENGTLLLDLLDELAATEEQALAPIAERSLSDDDWAAVRELEVGWSLITTPALLPAS